MDETARAHRLSEAAHFAWKAGNPARARRLLDVMTATVPEPVARPLAGRLRGLIELYSGNLAAAQDHLTRLAGRVDPGHAARVLFLAIDAAHHRDRWDDVLALARRITALPCEPGFHVLAELLAGERETPDPWQILDAVPDTLTERHAHRWLVTMAISRRGPHRQATREFGLVAAERLRANGISALYAVLLPWLAELELDLGRWDDARAHAKEALRAAAEQRVTAVDAHAVLARLAALRGDTEACREHAGLVLREAPAQDNALAAAQARWALGALHLSRGEYDAAVERLSSLGHRDVAAAAAVDRAEALSGGLTRCPAPDTPFERARGRLRDGQRLRRERRLTAAKVELRAALETFESLGAAEWAATAGRELRAAGSPASATGRLTAQERQVAELAAAGLSNREIGARLFLSPRTVGYHLYKVFPKLGIASRAQLRDVALPG
ncbi:LuxR family transcriptional regulator [Amycolatopsis australiensis]|uniref:Regulatory protein, luxR family n=1 Tax=Amycolatopsis australiensis TaxID=546364 RepID=A0A1K1PQT1_9PSEU|nr:LuxR family transcriptional regulator [Amycolatopsis australiensis]SFW49889.1 regulatory protein, luxR family [Amycolatopsis australiensis]